MDRIKQVFKNLNIELTEKQVNQFFCFYKLLNETNKTLNLTAITDYEEVLVKHFLDSASITLFYNDLSGSLIDIGTGAGFPGIPLKILFPQLQVTLADSLNKRVSFLDSVIKALELENISTVHERAEILGQDTQYREKYDFCVSRAVANVSSLLEYCSPFVKVNGQIILYKSANIEQEIQNAGNAIKCLNCKLEKVGNFNLPGTDIKRTFIILIKTGVLSKKFPRKAGIPTKQPL